MRRYVLVPAVLGVTITSSVMSQPPVRPRVVLISVDGGSDAVLDALLARRALTGGGFAAFVSRGLVAESMTPINVASTPPSHASLYSGVTPGRHGIVGVSLPSFEDARARPRSGFLAPTAVDRLWTLAQRAGKRVVCVAAPGASALRPDSTCTRTLAFQQQAAEAFSVELRAAPMDGSEGAGTWRPLDPPQVRLGDTGQQLSVFASRGQHQPRPRILIADGPDPAASNRCEAAPERPCVLPLTIRGEPHSVLIDLVSADPNTGRFRIALGPTISHPTNDTRFRDELVTALGPSPGEPSARMVTRGELTEEQWIRQFHAFSDYLGGAVRFALARDDWDLLLAYVSYIDHAGHRYLVTDPRQAEYDEDGGLRRARCARYLEKAYDKVDGLLASWIAAAPEGTSLVLVSDHGMVPTHSAVLISNVLATAGIRVGGTGPIDARALSSGASAHIYLNRAGRFKNGIVHEAAVPAMIQRIARACRSVRDPVTGRPVFPIVAAGRQLDALGLQHPDAGDVFISTPPGWAVSDRFDAGVPVFVPTTLTADARRRISRSPAEQRFLEGGGLNELGNGVHGHVAGDPRLQAIFMALGPRVPHRRIGRIAAVDVMPTVLSLLGLEAPPYVIGRPAFAPSN